MTELDPAFAIADEQALRALYPAVTSLATDKVQGGLDKHARAFIARAPFLVIGTQSREGRADVSPRGDPAGFVRVLDDATLAIPDRPGNNRLDSLVNILANPSVGLLFIIPGFDETLRVNGVARLAANPALLETMQVDGRLPRLAIVVTVREAFLHCAKAFRRARLWDPAQQRDRRELPTLSKMILDQTTGAPEGEAMRKIDDDLEEEYKRTMY